MGPIQVTEAQAWGIALACVMMCVDVATGFLAAIANNEVSSTRMRKGLVHKVLVLMLVFACLAIELAGRHFIELPYDIPTCEVVCGYVVVMEVASVLENVSKGYPEFAGSALSKLFGFDGRDGDDAHH